VAIVTATCVITAAVNVMTNCRNNPRVCVYVT